MDQYLTITYRVTVCAARNFLLYRLSSIRHCLTNWSSRKCGQCTRHLSPRLLQVTLS